MASQSHGAPGGEYTHRPHFCLLVCFIHFVLIQQTLSPSPSRGEVIRPEEFLSKPPDPKEVGYIIILTEASMSSEGSFTVSISL